MNDAVDIAVAIGLFLFSVLSGVALWVWRLAGQLVPRTEVDRRFETLRREIHDDMSAIERRSSTMLTNAEIRTDKRFDTLDQRLASMDEKLDRLIERRIIGD